MTKNNIQIIRGDTLILEVYIIDELNEPFNLNNASVYFTVKENLNDPDEKAIIQVKKDEHENPEKGYTIIEVPYSLTKRLNPKKIYFYDIQVSKERRIFTVSYGNIQVLPDVTLRER